MSSTLIVTAVAALSLAAATFMLVLVTSPQPASRFLERRLGKGAPLDTAYMLDPDQAELQKPLMERMILPLMQGIGRYMVRRTKVGQVDALRQKLVQAGSQRRAETLLALKVVLLPVGLGVGAALVVLLGLTGSAQIASPVGLAILGYIYPSSSLNRKIKKRAKQIRLALPGVLDLLTISMEAGLSLDMAIMRVCDSDATLLGQEFRKMLNEVRLGRPRMEALSAMADRNAVEELSGFVRAVVQSEPLGVSIGNVLRIQSEEIRRLRKQRAEEAGHRAPVLMLLPMVGCIFPCIFVCLLGPAALVIVGPK